MVISGGDAIGETHNLRMELQVGGRPLLVVAQAVLDEWRRAQPVGITSLTPFDHLECDETGAAAADAAEEVLVIKPNAFGGLAAAWAGPRDRLRCQIEKRAPILPRELARTTSVNLWLMQWWQDVATACGGGNLGEALDVHHLVREAELAVLTPVDVLILDEALAMPSLCGVVGRVFRGERAQPERGVGRRAGHVDDERASTGARG